jgi:hypothetical protein
MAPSWARGGLYYPRNDTVEDADGNRTLMEPMSGNVLLGYARLNIPDGLWHFYNEPWEQGHFEAPALDSVATDIDVSHAVFTPAANRLTFSIARRGDGSGDGSVRISRALSRGTWSLTCDGQEIGRGAPAAVFATSDAIHAGVEGDEIVLRFAKGVTSRCAIAFS